MSTVVSLKNEITKFFERIDKEQSRKFAQEALDKGGS